MALNTLQLDRVQFYLKGMECGMECFGALSGSSSKYFLTSCKFYKQLRSRLFVTEEESLSTTLFCFQQPKQNEVIIIIIIIIINK
jgi:hypothetical protein